MLVLSRKIGESVLIDGDIVVRVLSLQGGRIRRGVEAPADVPVLRAELVTSTEQFALGAVDVEYSR